MNKKEARTEALRIAVALLHSGVYFEGEYGEEDEIKVQHEINNVADSLYKKAVRLGGEFNRFTGYVNNKKITI